MAEILHQLIGSLSHYLEGFIHPRWCKISAINSRTSLKLTGFVTAYQPLITPQKKNTSSHLPNFHQYSTVNRKTHLGCQSFCCMCQAAEGSCSSFLRLVRAWGVLVITPRRPWPFGGNPSQQHVIKQRMMNIENWFIEICVFEGTLWCSLPLKGTENHTVSSYWLL